MLLCTQSYNKKSITPTFMSTFWIKRQTID